MIEAGFAFDQVRGLFVHCSVQGHDRFDPKLYSIGRYPWIQKVPSGDTVIWCQCALSTVRMTPGLVFEDQLRRGSYG